MSIPFTSNLETLRFPHTLRVDPSPTNGLITPSVLLVFQLRAIDKGRIGRKVGQLEIRYMDQLDLEIRNLLGI